jgi:hypothetical protein
MNTWTAIWEFLNSSLGITMLVTAFVAIINRNSKAQTLLQKYQGTIISAIKTAEKAIPDDLPNKGLRRLDEALRLTLAVMEQAQGKIATPAQVAEIKEAIQLTHAQLEASGNLATPAGKEASNDDLPDLSK